MKDLTTVEEENAIAKELLEMLAGKEISVRKARWILRKAEEMLEDTPLQKPEELAAAKRHRKGDMKYESYRGDLEK